ncbi:interleukin-6 receptor subunit alpha [Solea solea]|uniref:interleukin-6 receptor subunit alpha n=1 Tax=Solea solea TaxID=90069 RepID=UPI00272C405D|nr:interleukin-6 receptor subunit alpha [Solea solea]
MLILLIVLSVVVVAQDHSIFDGTCPRKDPPAGVLVLSPGSNLVLTCKGHVMVDGVKVNTDNNSSITGKESSSVASTDAGNAINNHQVTYSSEKEGFHTNPEAENKSLRFTDTAHTDSPTTHMVQPTSAGRLLKSEYDLEVDEDGDYEEDEEQDLDEGRTRVTRGIKSKLQWKWNGKTVETGVRNQSEITLERRGASLSLSAVRVTDTGRYSCHHKGREKFSLKVLVSDPPERPTLSCYKKTPTSKIRCEWKPQLPVIKQMSSYLILKKSLSETFHQSQCSYSGQRSRFWCALDQNEDELRVLHMAYLCVSSITGQVASPLLPFTPMDIVKPDPPSDVTATQEEGHEMRIKVAWNFPASWKLQDRFYHLIYEVKYRLLESPFTDGQVKRIKRLHSHTITDAIPGVQYLIWLRTKEEYEGQWSDWTSPLSASSWTAPKISDELMTTMFPESMEEGSATEDDVSDVPGHVISGVEVSHHVLWMCGSFLLLSVLLAVYMFRHKDRLIHKLCCLSAIVQSADSPQPAASTQSAPEGRALVTFTPPCHKEPPPTEAEEGEEENEEEEEEDEIEERTGAMHFSNTGYFWILRE